MSWFKIPNVHEVKLCGDRKTKIESEPWGDFFWYWSVKLQRREEPRVQDILKAAEGRWMYKPVRLRLEIDKPPVDFRLAIYTHPTLVGIRREYLFPDSLTPPLIRGIFEWTFRAELNNHLYNIVLATLPGDRIYIDLKTKHRFTGSLEVLYCAS